MEFSYLCVRNVEDVKKHSPEKVAADIIGEISYRIISDTQTLKRLETDSPKGEVTVLVKYNTEGRKSELTGEQRGKLSSLSYLHKYLTDKVRNETDFEKVLSYSQLIKFLLDLMKEIEEKDEN